jgi:cation:H+ antiporter
MAFEQITAVLGFIVGTALLIKGADLFVGGGSGLAARYRISPTLIGFTVIAFGTSFPEFVVNLQAVVADTPDLALGNILGSTVANIALVLAICAIVNPAAIRQDQSVRGISEVYLMIGAVGIFSLLALRMAFDLYAGIVMLGIFAVIMWLIWEQGTVEKPVLKSHGIRDYLLTGGGLASVVLGANVLVGSATEIALILGISPFVIGVSMVAVGTSLPELATSLIAVVRGEGGISVGTIVGSNIFNLLFVMGIAALIRPIPIETYTDIVVMSGFAVGIIPFFFDRVRFRRLWGSLMLIAYGVYIVSLFATG